jgi:hypothetical protein
MFATGDIPFLTFSKNEKKEENYFFHISVLNFVFCLAHNRFL